MTHTNKFTTFLIFFAPLINCSMACSNPKTAFEKLANASARLKEALGQRQTNSWNQHHKDAFKYACLLREASELILHHAQLTEEQNKTGTKRFHEISALIEKILLNFKGQKALLKRHPQAHGEVVQKKLKDVEDLAAQYESCAQLVAFSQKLPSAQDLSEKTKQKLDVARTLFYEQDNKTQPILGTKQLTIEKTIQSYTQIKQATPKVGLEYAQEKKKLLKREAKKRRLARKKMEAHDNTLITRTQLFPILAIRCGLSTKTKDNNGFYLLQKKILNVPHSSYNTLHIIADYLNIRRTSLLNK